MSNENNLKSLLSSKWGSVNEKKSIDRSTNVDKSQEFFNQQRSQNNDKSEPQRHFEDMQHYDLLQRYFNIREMMQEDNSNCTSSKGDHQEPSSEEATSENRPQNKIINLSDLVFPNK